MNAIAGTYVVLLGWMLAGDKRAGLRGFAAKRTDPTEQESYWMGAPRPIGTDQD